MRASADDRFVAARVTARIDPVDLNLVALLSAPETKRQERILGNRRAPLRRQHRAAVPGHADLLDEPCRNRLSRSILALTGLHLVAHQDLHVGLVAHLGGANFHRVCHAAPPPTRRGPRWSPSPPWR